MTTATLTRPATLRPVLAADAEAMQRFVTGLDAAARRLRFHGAVNACTPGLLRHLTQADGVRHVAFVACIDGEVVGEARYFVDAETGTSAEFAIAVAESVRGSGIAAELLQQLMLAAGRAGLRTLHGDVLDGNQRMAAFMRRQGFEIDVFAETGGSMARWQRNVPPAGRKTPATHGNTPQWPAVRALQAWWGRVAHSFSGSVVAAPQ